MILRAYTFPCGKATDQNTDVYIEVLKKIMRSLSVSEMLFSDYSGTGNLFIYSEQTAPSLEKVKDTLNQILKLKIRYFLYYILVKGFSL